MFGMFGMTSNLIMLTQRNISNEVVQFNSRLFKSIFETMNTVFSVKSTQGNIHYKVCLMRMRAVWGIALWGTLYWTSEQK